MAKPNALSRRDLLRTTAAGALGLGLSQTIAKAEAAGNVPERAKGQKSVMGLKFPPLKEVRVGLIGVGGRGMSHLGSLLAIDNVKITAVCDIVPSRVAAAQARVVKKGQPEPAGFSKNETDFENLCKRDDVDIIYAATPWVWHTPMALCAMKNGKHAAIEVSAIVTMEECWELVNVAEQTQRHCIMLENCCYGETEMLILNMVRMGLFGELTHGEAGYIHDLRGVLYHEAGEGKWRRAYHSQFDGNLYPTHGLGPVAQYMGINGGDKFEYLVSMSSLEHSLSKRRDKLPAGDPRRNEKFICGDMNTTIIKTALGRTIMVQHDVVTPRPYSRINMICGTGGTFLDYPPRFYMESLMEQPASKPASQPATQAASKPAKAARRPTGHGFDDDEAYYQERFGHPLWKKMREAAKKSGGHGGMDFMMNWRLMQCLLNGEPLDMSVYDAAAWSCIFPLSVASVAKGSAPIQIPDFTRGEWKNAKPLGIIGA